MSSYKGCELVKGGLYKVTFDFLILRTDNHIIGEFVKEETTCGHLPVLEFNILASTWADAPHKQYDSLRWTIDRISKIELVEIRDLPLYVYLNCTDIFLTFLEGE